MSADQRADTSVRSRLTQAAETLRRATADALARSSWFAPTLDDCRGDAERLLLLGNLGPLAEALLARAELVLRTWQKLQASSGEYAAIRRCPGCGAGALRPLARAGRTVPFRGEQVEIPADFAIPTCDRCGAESLDTATAERLDRQLLSAWAWSHR